MSENERRKRAICAMVAAAIGMGLSREELAAVFRIAANALLGEKP